MPRPTLAERIDAVEATPLPHPLPLTCECCGWGGAPGDAVDLFHGDDGVLEALCVSAQRCDARFCASLDAERLDALARQPAADDGGGDESIPF